MYFFKSLALNICLSTDGGLKSLISFAAVQARNQATAQKNFFQCVHLSGTTTNYNNFASHENSMTTSYNQFGSPNTENISWLQQHI